MRAGLPLADRPPVSAMPSPILIGSAARATKTPAPASTTAPTTTHTSAPTTSLPIRSVSIGSLFFDVFISSLAVYPSRSYSATRVPGNANRPPLTPGAPTRSRAKMPEGQSRAPAIAEAAGAGARRNSRASHARGAMRVAASSKSGSLTSAEAVVTTRLKRPRARGDDDGVEPERLPGRARRRPDPRRRRGRSDHAGRRGLLGQPPADRPEPAQGLPGLEALRHSREGSRAAGEGARHRAAERRARARRPHVHARPRRLQAGRRRTVQGSEAARRRRRHHEASDSDPLRGRRRPLPGLGRHHHEGP